MAAAGGKGIKERRLSQAPQLQAPHLASPLAHRHLTHTSPRPLFDAVTAAAPSRARATPPPQHRRLNGRPLWPLCCQVLSAGSPTYLHDRCLSPHPIDYSAPRPYAALAKAADGYTLVHVFVDVNTHHANRRSARLLSGDRIGRLCC